MKSDLIAASLFAVSIAAVAATSSAAMPLVVAQAMVPPTGMGDADKPMPMDERMQRRFPQPVRVGDLIGLRMLDDDDRTIGFIREVVRTPQNRIELIVAYDGWLGFGSRLVAVPIEVVAILGRQVASLDMPPAEYAAAPTWQDANARVLDPDDSIRIALGRR
jgi:hypothetical protein